MDDSFTEGGENCYTVRAEISFSPNLIRGHVSGPRACMRHQNIGAGSLLFGGKATASGKEDYN